MQVGGDHYARGGDVQHWDLISDNFGPGYLIGCATKYITRWQQKNGLQDLQKAHHYCVKLHEKALQHTWRPGPPVEVDPFLTHNIIVGTDARIVYLLTNWRSANDFIIAANLIEELIKDHNGL